jgi:hypothetical protein
MTAQNPQHASCHVNSRMNECPWLSMEMCVCDAVASARQAAVAALMMATHRADSGFA